MYLFVLFSYGNITGAKKEDPLLKIVVKRNMHMTSDLKSAQCIMMRNQFSTYERLENRQLMISKII